jgi:hypothetical protein
MVAGAFILEVAGVVVLNVLSELLGWSGLSVPSSSPPSLAPFIWVGGGSLTVALIYAARFCSRIGHKELGSMSLGLALGGGMWLATVVGLLGASDQELLNFLREHSFDYFTAGAMAAVVAYLVVDRQPLVRMAACQPVYLLVGSLTGFAVGAPWFQLASVAFACGLSGSVSGFLMPPMPAQEKSGHGAARRRD